MSVVATGAAKTKSSLLDFANMDISSLRNLDDVVFKLQSGGEPRVAWLAHVPACVCSSPSLPHTTDAHVDRICMKVGTVAQSEEGDARTVTLTGSARDKVIINGGTSEAHYQANPDSDGDLEAIEIPDAERRRLAGAPAGDHQPNRELNFGGALMTSGTHLCMV